MQIMHLIIFIWIENLDEDDDKEENDEFIQIGVKRSLNNKHHLCRYEKKNPFTTQLLFAYRSAEYAERFLFGFIIFFGEKSYCYGRIGPCNQDQVNENIAIVQENPIN